MNYEIVELDELTGNAATIYSVILEGSEETLFDRFVLENQETYADEIRFIVNRIEQMGKNVGARHNFFKHDEGKPGDGVCALFDDPEKNLRLYCIRYGSVAIILGGGGLKPENIQAWQEDAKLSEEANCMIKISKDISERLKKDGDLSWSEDGKTLTGNLNKSDDGN